jgi:SRSO17 transposase
MAALRGSVAELDAWLAQFLDVMGRKTRRSWAPLYIRGLRGPRERKSLPPRAARMGLPGHGQLHHFITSSAWDDAPLWRMWAETAGRPLGGPDAVLMVDDRALPKKGELPVGVARQYCGHLVKRANCRGCYR